MATNNIAPQVEHIAQMSEERSAVAGIGAEAARELGRQGTELQHVVGAYRL